MIYKYYINGVSDDRADIDILQNQVIELIFLY